MTEKQSDSLRNQRIRILLCLKNAYAMGAGKAAVVVLGKELVDRMSPDKYTSALRLLNDITGNKMNNFDIEHPRLEKRMEYIADAFERR